MSRVLIITGMHRSATSLVAALFQHAGVNLGERLLAPTPHNPRGYFEDQDFFQFHAQLLRTRGQNILVGRDFVFTPTPAEIESARQLIQPRAARPLWGWKDPRTALFLDFWSELIPDAHFLFLYRHPLDVLLSLVRRSEFYNWGLLEGLEAWYVYNLRIWEFCEHYPDSTLLCHAYAVLDQIDAFTQLVQEKFRLDLKLDAKILAELYEPTLLVRAPLTLTLEAVFQSIHPDSAQLYRQLNERADLHFTDATRPDDAPDLTAWNYFLCAQPKPFTPALQRGLLLTLLALLDPPAVENFFAQHVHELGQLEEQHTNWQQTAEERARVIREMQAWSQPRMEYLKNLESSSVVRLLVRLGLLPHN